jgi:hypothetical protein
VASGPGGGWFSRATMWLSRALAGPPGEEILLTGEGLEQWTQGEVRKISKALCRAPKLAAVSVLSPSGPGWTGRR